MKKEIDPNDIYKRKADDRGRLSLPTSEFKNEELEIAVLNSEEDDDVLLLDERDEAYGYGVYNVHANCFIDLPEPMSGRPSTPDHITKERDPDLLNKVADDHGLDSVSHLRVVQIRLDNKLDKKASENF